ncbi:MAG: hypothetical protein SFW36_23310 [Leptolyngbyaceae cyanobacterium bins.59]|nr:hypothetical protein [Leptolyngbyaceae cyanobacterium bins.59]
MGIQFVHPAQGHGRSSASGFTLLELTIIGFIVGILGLVSAPSWLGFVNTLQLNSSRDRVYQAMQEAKSNSVRDNLRWQVTFRQVDDTVQAAVHPVIEGRFMPPTVHWQTIGQVRIDEAETTLHCSSRNCQTPGTLWRVQFNHRGNTNGQLGRITLMGHRNVRVKRCVIVSTLIGHLRVAQQQSRPDENKRYCY